ncbi:MAG TPA: DUF2630 family protein [Conexibacter sp.]|jgi:hypothetical protein
MPTDEQIQDQIERLEDERLRLREREGSADQTLDADRRRIAEISIELERLWEFHRQRVALRDAGRDPEEATGRAADIVEKYWP